MADQYQVTMEASGFDVGEILITVQRVNEAVECEEIFWQYRNRFPIDPLGSFWGHLLPGWISPEEFPPPCRICVRASTGRLVPELQLIYIANTDPDDDFEFRLVLGNRSSDWRWLSGDDEATTQAIFAAAVADIGGVAAVAGTTVEASPTQRHWLAIAKLSQGVPKDLVEIELRSQGMGASSMVERLQTGGGLVNDEYQLVREDSQTGTNGTLTYDGVESATINASDTAAAAVLALEAVLGAGNVAVPAKTTNLMVVQFKGALSNTDALTLVGSAGLNVVVGNDGSPPT